MLNPPVVLVIAGFDGSGGAGIQADTRAIHLSGCYACSVVTAVTAQNTLAVRHVETLPAKSIHEQLNAIFDDFQVRAIKMGLLPSSETIETVVSVLDERQSSCPVVVDPVLGSTSGRLFLEIDARNMLLTQIFPISTLVTPNTAEAEILSNKHVKYVDDAIVSGNQLLKTGCKNVLVTGGHLEADVGTDVWIHKDGYEVFEARERHDGTVRGTGCMLSSAIACHLANGVSVRDAILSARTFIVEALGCRRSIGQGTPISTIGMAVDDK